MKKMYATLLSAAMLLSVCSCGGGRYGEDSESESINLSQTQLYVGTYDGGLGKDWIDKAAARFEALYADYSFEPGKVGIDIHSSKEKSYGTTTFVSKIGTVRDEIFFVELSDYYELINKNKVLDITDAVTQPLTEYGEDESIEDKMYDSDVNFFKTSEGKYYGLPFYEAAYGLFYDAALFREMNFYFAAEGEGDSRGFVRSETTKKSNGPDGKEGTSDDGLPATYDEFFALCDKMTDSDVTPLVWPGSVNTGTTNFLMRSLWADYEGQAQMELNYNFSGTATHLVDSFDANGNPVLKSETITKENGYLLQKQAGKYYALEFMERLFSNDEYYEANRVFSTGYSQTAAQRAFLQGRIVPGETTYGMYLDGTWWFNEASNVFTDMERYPDSGKEDREIAFMPLPKPTAADAGDFTYMSCYLTEAVIDAKIDPAKIEAATAFLRFLHTDQSLSEFTVETNTLRPFDYELTEADAQNATPYLDSLLEIHNNSDIVVPYAANNLYLSNVSNFITARGLFNSKIGDKDWEYYVDAWRDGKVTSEAYFKGLADYWTQAQWNSTYERFF